MNVKPETRKFLKEYIDWKLFDTGLGDDFLNLTPKAKIVNKENTTKKFVYFRGNQQNEKATF